LDKKWYCLKIWLWLAVPPFISLFTVGHFILMNYNFYIIHSFSYFIFISESYVWFTRYGGVHTRVVEYFIFKELGLELHILKLVAVGMVFVCSWTWYKHKICDRNWYCM
jgi:hypothetical protein